MLVPAVAFSVQITKHFTSGHNFSCSVAKAAAALGHHHRKTSQDPSLELGLGFAAGNVTWALLTANKRCTGLWRSELGELLSPPCRCCRP